MYWHWAPWLSKNIKKTWSICSASQAFTAPAAPAPQAPQFRSVGELEAMSDAKLKQLAIDFRRRRALKSQVWQHPAHARIGCCWDVFCFFFDGKSWKTPKRILWEVWKMTSVQEKSYFKKIKPSSICLKVSVKKLPQVCINHCVLLQRCSFGSLIDFSICLMRMSPFLGASQKMGCWDLGTFDPWSGFAIACRWIFVDPSRVIMEHCRGSHK